MIYLSRMKNPNLPYPSVAAALRAYVLRPASLDVLASLGTTVLPNTGTPPVPEYFCPIPEQIVLKEEQIVYRFELLHSGLIALFQNKSFKDQADRKSVV